MNVNPITFRASVQYNKEVEQNLINESPNPLRLKANLSSLSALSNYNQVMVKPRYDKDIMYVLTRIDELNKVTPVKLEMPYSFDLNTLNGERIRDEEGNLLCIREYGNNFVREYYPGKDGNTIEKILEKDKDSGALISKVDRITKEDGSVRTAITVFDEKINNKYTIFQAEEDGTISSTTEFLGKGKNFRTLFRNPYNNQPVKYIEAKESDDGEFEYLDCKLDSNGQIAEIKRISSDKEVNIRYTGNQKIVDVKPKNIDY